MAEALEVFLRVLRDFGCSATFPITSVVLARNRELISRYQKEEIEFAVHGYRHTDFSRMTLGMQLDELERAVRIFRVCGIRAEGFRGPYLRRTAQTARALRESDLLYDATPALAWPCLPAPPSPAYLQALVFYNAVEASDFPALPEMDNGVVQIPYCLPDDESVVDRLALTAHQIADVWLAILDETMQRGELFVLGIHPERIRPCRQPLETVLSAAAGSGTVWIARLCEIAAWWRNRTNAQVRISDESNGKTRVSVEGAMGTTLLVRGVDVDSPTAPAFDGYRRVTGSDVTFRSAVRPFIGVAPGTCPRTVSFLLEQGYIVDSAQPSACSHQLDLPDFRPTQKRALLQQLEQTNRPLIRLARWPHGARSVLAITGDIDAMSSWDYGLRLIGR